MHLKAMILEVNNTFDERRMYFLKDNSKAKDATKASDGETLTTVEAVTLVEKLSDGSSIPPDPAHKFTIQWPKDFHVSPFNSRKGSYSLAAYDPFGPSQDKKVEINNTITLISSQNHAKLVARIFSTSPSVDPSTMTTRHKLQFLLSWWWVGLVTFPRIVREAGKLFFKRKLHVWFRPEVLSQSIGRKETQREGSVPSCFEPHALPTTKFHD